jgi:ABC-2 type transport system ATP-binding protein
MITARNLSKYFGSTQALKNISFEVKQGEVLGFLGPNGAGKTTTMRVLTCYVPARPQPCVFSPVIIRQIQVRLP